MVLVALILGCVRKGHIKILKLTVIQQMSRDPARYHQPASQNKFQGIGA
jgi:hypothetical protein